MDFYNALKGGQTPEELRALFQKNLDEATARIEQEKKEAEAKKAKTAELDKARREAATAYQNYQRILKGDKFDESVYTIETIEEGFKYAEKGSKALNVLEKSVDKFISELYGELSKKSDDEIINRFLKSFK